VRTEDFAADPRFLEDRYLPIARADGVVSAMAVPVVTAGTVVVGVIYANRRTRQPFTAADEAALMTLADHAAVAVQQATLLAREHAARADAEAASRGKDELLAMLGHELRNPLSAISNAMHVLSAPGASEDARLRARDIITRQNAHLAHLVDDLLDVARVTSGKIALARRPLELAGAVRQSVATLTASGRTGAHDLRLDLEAVWGNVDETRFEQIVANLLGNALRFTPDGGRVEVSLRAWPGEAVLSVRDSGVGITPDMLPRVFDLFVQGERGADRGGGGLGLGLALVRRIAELHGGGVEARSDGPGRGSEFIVRLPAIPAPPVAARRPGPAEGNGAPRRILVVEDNEDSREMLRHLLMLDGHQVYEAADGPAGLEAAVRLRPDIAFVDVGLPGLDGYEVARQVRAETGRGDPSGRAHRLWAAGGPPPGAGGRLRRAYREAHRARGAARSDTISSRSSNELDGKRLRPPLRTSAAAGRPQRAPVASRAPATIADSLACASARGRCFMPQSGATTSREAGRCFSAASIRLATVSEDSATGEPRSSTPRTMVLDGSAARTAGSRPGWAASMEIWSAAQRSSSGRKE
jgi:signal transduction histidine kinase